MLEEILNKIITAAHHEQLKIIHLRHKNTKKEYPFLCLYIEDTEGEDFIMPLAKIRTPGTIEKNYELFV